MFPAATIIYNYHDITLQPQLQLQLQVRLQLRIQRQLHLHYSTLHHYTPLIYATPQLQIKLDTVHYSTATTGTTAYATLHPAFVGDVTAATAPKEDSSNYLVHQWIRSVIYASQQLSSPKGFLFWTFLLAPPPCAVLLVLVLR